VLAAAVIVGGFVYAFTRPGGAFALDMPGLKFNLKAPTNVAVSESKLKSFDAADYVVDDINGFAYRRPASPPWSNPEAIHGYASLLAAQQFSSPAVSASNVNEQLREVGRLGAMIRGVESVRVTSGQPVIVRSTKDSTLSVFDQEVPIGTSRLLFKNSFVVESFKKSVLRGLDVPLASLFSVTTSTVGTALADVTAHDGSIGATASLHFSNVLVNGKPGRFDVYHAFLFSESPRNYYVVEIVYSPETNAAEQRWEDLQSMLSSFRVR
jgi:hypothetical protein